MGFYLLLKTNTTSLERDLGELLAQLSAHSGPLSETGATMAAIMEITSEATVRGRVFWSQLQGRRSSPATWIQSFLFNLVVGAFWTKIPSHIWCGCQGPRSPAHSPWSTVQGPQARHFRCCSSRIAEVSAKPSSFVPGLSLPLTRAPLSLAGTRWAPGESQASASLKNFNKQTERKRNSTLAYAWRCFIWFLNSRQGPVIRVKFDWSHCPGHAATAKNCSWRSSCSKCSPWASAVPEICCP